MTQKHVSRRRFLRRSAMWGSGAFGALATGLPLPFLLDRRTAEAQEEDRPTFFILSAAQAGHPSNANVPGTYPVDPSDMNDPITRVDHPRVADLGMNAMGEAAGMAFGAADFETPVDLWEGLPSARAAGPYSALDSTLLARTTFFHHQTYSNAHPEFANVMQFHGAVKSRTGVGPEMLPSMIAQETAGALGTLMENPINVGGSLISTDGRPLSVFDPPELKSLFAGTQHPTGVPDPSEVVRLRDAILDDVYADVRENGTHAQRVFLDRYALSREQAADLGGALGPLLSDVDGRTSRDQVLAAVALLKLRVTPVIVLNFRSGGDNHRDNQLANEVTETIERVDAISFLWSRLVEEGLEDQVTFAGLDVFGRKLIRNDTGGRDHNRNHHAMMMFGPRIRSGVVGGLEPTMRRDDIVDFEASAIGDVPQDETLQSAGKTLSAAIGIPQERIDTRILGGQVIEDAVLRD